MHQVSIVKLSTRLWLTDFCSRGNRFTNRVSTSPPSSTLILNFTASLSRWEQQFSLPITISTENDPDLALWTAIMPTTAFVLAYQFYLKPRRRKRRAE